jgi:hypothetical protein
MDYAWLFPFIMIALCVLMTGGRMLGCGQDQ